MNVKELHKLAKKKGIKNHWKMRKAELQKTLGLNDKKAECKAKGLVYDPKTKKCRKSVVQKRAECKARKLVYDPKTKKCRKSVAQKRAECKSKGLVYNPKTKRCRKSKVLKKQWREGQVFNGKVDISHDCKISNDMYMNEPLATHPNIKKIIYKNWNGTCFDINELAQNLIATKGKNIDPMRLAEGKAEPLWRNENELLNLKIFGETAIRNKSLRHNFSKLLQHELLVLITPPYIDVVMKNMDILNQIFLTGCIAIGDHFSSHKVGIFSDAVLALGKLATKIDTLSPAKQQLFLNLKMNTGKTLREILATSNNTCIHGIGFDLCCIYFQTFISIYIVDNSISLYPNIIDIDSTFVWAVRTDDIKKKQILIWNPSQYGYGGAHRLGYYIKNSGWRGSIAGRRPFEKKLIKNLKPHLPSLKSFPLKRKRKRVKR